MARAEKSISLLIYCSSACVCLSSQLYGQAVALFIWRLSGVDVCKGKLYLFFPDHAALPVAKGEG